MMSTNYKRLLPSIFLKNGEGVAWFDGSPITLPDPIAAAEDFNNYGADGIIVFDLSEEDDEHDVNMLMIRKICQAVDVPVYGAGRIRRLDDIKKLIYAGCHKACLNFAREDNVDLATGVGARFGRDQLAICVDNVSQLEDNQNLIKNYVSEIILVNNVSLPACAEWIMSSCNRNANPISLSLDCVFKDITLHDAAASLRAFPALTGISGGELNISCKTFMDFKRQCKSLNIPINTFESSIAWSELKLNNDGMIPVIVQDYKTDEVLMLAYMNEESFNHTIKTGLMTYWSRSRNELWEKGDTSGHFQYVKSLSCDCDKDTILAKVLQIGAACHTGKRSCFFNTMMKKEYDDTNPLKVFEKEYNVILDRKEHPTDGSYTTYLFESGLDKILKKVGEECTELIIAAKNPNPEELKYEIADFLYHAMVLMVEKGVTWNEIIKEISHR